MKSEILAIVFLLIFILIGIYFINIETGNVVLNEQEILVIPVKVHIIVDDSGRYTSNRNEENILKTFEKANRIWEQGNVVFQIEEIQETRVAFETIPLVINGNVFELRDHENFDSTKLNVFFVQSLNNINGLALIRINSVLVADFTTVNDFRTLSHEFGHLLGLVHVPNPNDLMARGKNGEFISNREVQLSRENAKLFFN